MDAATNLRDQIRANENRNAAAQREINAARAQIDALNEKIRVLLDERRGLEDFHLETQRDFADLRSQADERRTAFVSLGAIPNVSLFKALSSKIASQNGSGTKRDIDRAHDDVKRQIARALSDVDEEISRLRSQIALLDNSINQNLMLIRQNDGTIRRLRSEINSLG